MFYIETPLLTVLILLLIRRSLQRLNTIARVNMDGVAEDRVSFLDIPVAVYSGLIVSTGNCSVENINMNISIRDRQIDGK